MPFALGIIGLLLIISGARGTYGQLKELLVDDFTGEGNFFYWIVALGVVGSIGYIQGLERFSRTFMALIILAMILSNRGFFNRFMEALQSLKSAGTVPESGGTRATAAGGASAVDNGRVAMPSVVDALPAIITAPTRIFGAFF